MKYKVGDKVRVKSTSWYHYNKNTEGNVECGTQVFISDMYEYCGKILTIGKVRDDHYRVQEADWHWTDEMFEDIIEDMKEVKIEIPKGYVIDKENSTFECIKFKKQAEVIIERISTGCCMGTKIKTPDTEFTLLDTYEVLASWDNAKKHCKTIHYMSELPSVEQLKLIYKYKDEINKYLTHEIEDGLYWSSKEQDSFYCWYMNMLNGHSSNCYRINANWVRPVINR